MPRIKRSTVRHRKLFESIDWLLTSDATAEAAIEGAIWEIERDPKRLGFYNQEMDVWYAKLTLPSRTEVVLYYSINQRFVMMLTIKVV
jgi:hypothetical protein